jgi:hypothetical protein
MPGLESLDVENFHVEVSVSGHGRAYGSRVSVPRLGRRLRSELLARRRGARSSVVVVAAEPEN